MEHTIQRMTRILGASAIENSGHDTRFVVEGAAGGKLKVAVEAAAQRIMAVLKDAQGVTRATIDVAPVTHVTDHKTHPHRVTLHIGSLRVHLDSHPSLAIEVVSADGEPDDD